MDYLHSPESSISNYLRRLRAEIKDDRIIWGPTFLQVSVSGGKVVYNFKIVQNGNNDAARQKLLEIPDVTKSTVKEDDSGIIIEAEFSYDEARRKIDTELSGMEGNSMAETCDRMGLTPNSGQFFLGRLGETTADHAKRTLQEVLDKLYS